MVIMAILVLLLLKQHAQTRTVLNPAALNQEIIGVRIILVRIIARLLVQNVQAQMAIQIITMFVIIRHDNLLIISLCFNYTLSGPSFPLLNFHRKPIALHLYRLTALKYCTVLLHIH